MSRPAIELRDALMVYEQAHHGVIGCTGNIVQVGLPWGCRMH